MSWLFKLSETYDNAVKNKKLKGPMPLAHVYQQADIEVTLDGNGNFVEAGFVNKISTLVPATESSAGRTSGLSPHPLCDKLQYVAGDYKQYGGTSKPCFKDYLSLLSSWYKSSKHPFLKAVLTYVEKRTLIKDLVDKGLLSLDTKGRLCSNEFIRWKVEIPGESCSEVWKKDDLIDSWSKFNFRFRQSGQALCYVSGEIRPYTVNHPARIRYSGDKAKLISANDTSGYTFRGRFISSEQACVVSYEISQKAHAALRWLVERQAFKNDSMVILAWAVSGAKVPPLTDGTDKLGEEAEDVENDLGLSDDDTHDSVSGDMGQAYAKNLGKKIWGYKKELKDRDDIVVMSLDSAGPGRMAIMYYREIRSSEFLARIEKYHKQYAWRQDFGAKRRFTGAPGLRDIAQMAYAGKSNSLTKATIERLIPVVVDGMPMPKDLVLSMCRRAASPLGLETWEFNKILGMACGMYAGSHEEGGYKMSLEKDRLSRDYLYGRLLAVADRLEGHALNISDENRDTSAIKLMQRFAEKPYTTWLQIESNLVPYNSRLKAKRPESWSFYNNLLDEIYDKFLTDDFTRNTPLTGEFLLGFHCQRMELWRKEAKTEDENN